MNKSLLACAALGVLLASGCGSVSTRDYAVIKEGLRSDPETRRVFVASCEADMKRGSARDLANFAALAGTSPARAPAVVCGRIARAIASGRISHSEFTAAGGDYSKWISVIRG